MNLAPPRLRMFAGPNGSGKSTIKAVLRPELLGVYVNPDEIEQDIYVNGIALGILELKRSTQSVSQGIRQNLDNQKKLFIRPFFSPFSGATFTLGSFCRLKKRVRPSTRTPCTAASLVPVAS